MQLSREQEKFPFDIPKMFRLIRHAIKSFPPAMLFELRDKGFDSPYEQLVACILSIRTLDETSLIAAEALFKRARTPENLLKIPEDKFIEIIKRCTFPGQKAQTLRKISQIVIEEHHGELPCEFNDLIALPGVGPKCANLVLGVACGQAHIGVDIHVHRVTNRWGYVQAKTPEKTMAALEKVLPKSKWVEINEILVPFGKHICLGIRPKCTQCPVLAYCRQIGVDKFQ